MVVDELEPELMRTVGSGSGWVTPVQIRFEHTNRAQKGNGYYSALISNNDA
jgi:hypothetical protein